EGDAGAAQSGDKLRMGSETDAAPGQRFFVALEYHGVPAGVAQNMGRQEPAQRSADDEGAASHQFPSPLSGQELGVRVIGPQEFGHIVEIPYDAHPVAPSLALRVRRTALPTKKGGCEITAAPRTDCRGRACNRCWSAPDCGSPAAGHTSD